MSAPQRPKPRTREALKPVAKPLGQILLAAGDVSRSELSLALDQQKTTKELLGEILIAQSLSAKISVINALAAQSGKAVADNSNAPKPFETNEPIYWITQAMVPLSKDGDHWQVATSDQSRFNKQRSAIQSKLGPASMVWASRAQIQARQQQLFGAQLAHHAKVCIPREQSCRGLEFTSLHKGIRWAVMAGLAVSRFFAHYPESHSSFFYPGRSVDGFQFDRLNAAKSDCVVVFAAVPTAKKTL